MEMYELQNQLELIVAYIYESSIKNEQHSLLSQAIRNYNQNVNSYAALLRKQNNLTHKGKYIKTPADFIRVCEKEGWNWLLDDAQEASSNA